MKGHQNPHDARRAGKKGKANSPWSRGPMVKTHANQERMAKWKETRNNEPSN